MTTLMQTKVFSVTFPIRLNAIRKLRGLTQEGLGKLAELTKLQIHRYERGASQPTLDTLKRLATALNVSIDELAFEEKERGPDEELRLQFEAIQNFTPEEKQVTKTVLEGLILKHDANRFNRAS
jgi:transcriptional regulator with XRE-family HTH domain